MPEISDTSNQPNTTASTPAEVLPQRPSSTPPASQHKHKKILLWAIIIVVILAVAILGRFLAQGNANIASFKYSQLNSYKLPGYYGASGMAFKKPIEVEPAINLPATKDSMILVHDKTLAGNKTITISYEAAYSAFNTMFTPRTQDLIDKTNASLTDPSNAGYTNSRATLLQFITKNTNKRWQINLGSSKPFTDTTINTAAWATDFTGKDSSPTSRYTPTKLQGQAVMAIGKNATYYFLAASVESNWTKNQQVWQQALNSLKIDQPQ